LKLEPFACKFLFNFNEDRRLFIAVIFFICINEMIFQKSLALVNKCAFLKSCSSVVIPRKEFVQQKGAMENKFDVVVVGGGIVGCATAREISNRMPELKIAIVEKESKLGKNLIFFPI
ncbi:L-2-hydroxyglutarate dehydrogenase, mitochondrial, partial [Trichinella pseudospiralis]